MMELLKRIFCPSRLCVGRLVRFKPDSVNGWMAGKVGRIVKVRKSYFEDNRNIYGVDIGGIVYLLMDDVLEVFDKGVQNGI